jgi:integrase
MHRGKRYYVSCRQLNVWPETKEASLAAANAWWEAKQAELYNAARRTPRPMEDVVAAVHGDGTSLDWQEQEQRRLADRFADFLATVPAILDMMGAPPGGPLPDLHPPDPAVLAEEARRRHLRDILIDLLEGEPFPQTALDRLPPARVAQIEGAVKELRGETAAKPDRTVRAHADTWHQSMQVRVAAGQMTQARCTINRGCLANFTGFIGETADVAIIDADKLRSYYEHVLAKIGERRAGNGGWAVAYARDVFGVAKTFVRWLAEREVIPLPINLGSKAFRFSGAARAISTWSPEELRSAVDAAPGKLALALLLMANTGATQADVSDLQDSEVDWQAGRIIRKRSKTASHENVPVVNYLLWPRTFELLKEHRSGGERVLLNAAGLPVVRTGRSGTRADGFASAFLRLRKKLGLKKTLKQLRKLGATLLDTHETYGRFKSLFLGHAPASMADRHYAAPSQQLFDSAVTWLGEQLGVIS